MNHTFNKFEQSLQQKFKLYDLINSDQINLMSLTLESDKLVELRNQLKANIVELLRINQNQPVFKHLQQEYLDSFAFLESYSTLIKLSQHLKAKQAKNKIESQKKIQDQATLNEENMKQFFNFKKEELFQEKICVLFLRITGNQIGYVASAQKIFLNYLVKQKQLANQQMKSYRLAFHNITTGIQVIIQIRQIS
ncbi:hypothetical protein ABPG72_005595 [Tetrahymena utriculariae]